MSVRKKALPEIEQEQLVFIKTNLRHKRDIFFYLNFGIYILPTLFVIGGCLIFYYGRVNPTTGAHIGNFLPMLVITLGIMMAYFFHIRIKEGERFIVMPISKFDIPSFEQALQNRFNISNIEINKSENALRAQTKTTLLSWGEEITVIQNNDQLLINSRSAGAKPPVMILKNRKNVEKLKGIIEKTCC